MRKISYQSKSITNNTGFTVIKIRYLKCTSAEIWIATSDTDIVGIHWVIRLGSILYRRRRPVCPI